MGFLFTGLKTGKSIQLFFKSKIPECINVRLSFQIELLPKIRNPTSEI